MLRPTPRLIVLTLLLAAAATGAHAEYYTVTLTNGTTFQTRYCRAVSSLKTVAYARLSALANMPCSWLRA